MIPPWKWHLLTKDEMHARPPAETHISLKVFSFKKDGNWMQNLENVWRKQSETVTRAEWMRCSDGCSAPFFLRLLSPLPYSTQRPTSKFNHVVILASREEKVTSSIVLWTIGNFSIRFYETDDDNFKKLFVTFFWLITHINLSRWTRGKAACCTILANFTSAFIKKKLLVGRPS